MTTTTASSSSPLECLFQLASSLHGGNTSSHGSSLSNSNKNQNDCSHSSSFLTLGQLVPVHQSLIRAVVAGGTNHDTTPGLSSTATKNVDCNTLLLSFDQDVIESLCVSPQEVTFCRRQVFVVAEADFGESSSSTSTTSSLSVSFPLLAGRLLTLQYLLYRQQQQQQQQQEQDGNPFQGLHQVVLPFLKLQQRQRQQKKNAAAAAENNNAVAHAHEQDEDDDCYMLDEFLNALLDAVFFPFSSDGAYFKSTRSSQDCCSVWLNQCLSSAADVQSGLGLSWNVQCRLLVRIHYWLSLLQQEKEEQNVQVLPVLMQSLVQATFQTTQRALTVLLSSKNSYTNDQQQSGDDDDPGSSSTNGTESFVHILRPVTSDLLALVDKIILEHSSLSSSPLSLQVQEHVQTLWNALWQQHQPGNHHKKKKNSERTLLVTTTFLCTLLPSVRDLRLMSTNPTTTGPAAAAKDDRQQSSWPIQQDQLWQLIFKCCRQGVFALSTSPSLQQQADKSKSSWIQHSITTTTPSPTTSMPAGNDDGDGDADDDDCITNDDTAPLLRRRGLYLLRTLVEKNNKSSNCDGVDDKNSDDTDKILLRWNQYVACMETIEMELEPHLVDQVWETVGELMASAAARAQAASAAAIETDGKTPSDDNKMQLVQPPEDVTWRWIQLLYARILTTRGEDTKPILRKTSLLALFQGRGGVLIQTEKHDNDDDKSQAVQGGNHKKKPSEERKQKSSKKKSATTVRPGAPLHTLSNEFILHILLPAFDSLEQSGVGTHLHYIHPDTNKGTNVDLDALLLDFLNAYWSTLDETKWQHFVQLLMSPETVCTLRNKTMTVLFERVAHWWLQRLPISSLLSSRTTTTTLSLRIPIQQATLEAVESGLSQLFSLGSLLLSYRESLLQSLSILLARSKPVDSFSPLSILGVLNLFTLPNSLEQEHNGAKHDVVDDAADAKAGEGKQDNQDCDSSFWMDNEPKFVALSRWLDGVSAAAVASSSWKQPTLVASTLASAFVDGHILAAAKDQSAASVASTWDPLAGNSSREREMGRSIVLLCTLITTNQSYHGSQQQSGYNGGASELLWPAINKGLVNAPMVMTTTSWQKADRIARSLLLLEYGSRVQVLSGSGNGDLIVDRKTQQMMPPPPSIEQLLAHAIAFCLHHVRHLLTPPGSDGNGGCTRSGTAKRMSSTLAELLSLLRTLKVAFPSSIAISDAVDETLKKSFAMIGDSDDNSSSGIGVKNLVILFAALTCGAGADTSRDKVLEMSRAILKLQTPVTAEGWAGDIQPLRSVFQYAKWGTLSCLLPQLVNEKGVENKQLSCFVDTLLEESINSVQATTADAIVALFDCVVLAANHCFSHAKLGQSGSERLGMIVNTLFSMMDDTNTTKESMYMLDEICRLVFQPSLLTDEYQRFRDDPDCLTPVRDAFRHTIKMAGTARPHMLRAALCWLVPGWLGDQSQGRTAIPYREDILQLLLYKEERLDDSSRNQGEARDFKIPEKTDTLSIVRAFVLVFLSKLPAIDSGAPPEIITGLVHFLILNLLEEVRDRGGKMIMTGTPEYCRKMRGWQALCVLTRFVSKDIAEQVCNKVFVALEEPLHGQTRYFLEIFCIQCSRKHPAIFGRELSKQIARQNLSLQLVSSYMVIAGNLIVGRYKDDFMGVPSSKGVYSVPLDEILAGVIPWVGSTQGFSRAIAQLLMYRLIPLVVDLSSDKLEQSTSDSEWYLRSLFQFLEENVEMKRLRQKQSKFFDNYDADQACTPEGVLSIPVDEGHEADPVYMVEVIRRALAEAYAEAHGNNSPTWKRVQEMLDSSKGAENDAENVHVGDGVVNFQRKIVPVDSLNLALEELREKKLRNFAGRVKQPLIVCASLIDKAPNLGGLARTSEIFATTSLVIPDARVTQQDDFKSVSVSAGEWISIEEVPPERLLAWLHARRDEGYFVVGVEQTFSSVKLSDFSFPTNRPTILLLGKEKEGIPVQFLRAVDQCVEIPQLGVTRSLNVHVSAAISIWEYTRQRIEDKSLKL